MFCDTAKVSLKAGKGGDGAVSFRHEIYINKGGPDGGNGGKGGSIIFVADKDTNTLIDFRFNPILTAENGGNGSGTRSAGRSGKDLLVEVPIGTVVKRDGQVIADLTHDGEKAVIAKGGDGGFGNAHFKSSVRQTPVIAEVGEPGDEFEAELELRLLADVGLVGLPNAGKSTFLSVVSNAKPEIADYPFTTLTPNLGVATIDRHDILIADIPGLIEGAAEGKGLGHDFLRHVDRTAVLLHLIDVYNNDAGELLLSQNVRVWIRILLKCRSSLLDSITPAQPSSLFLLLLIKELMICFASCGRKLRNLRSRQKIERLKFYLKPLKLI